MTPEDQIVTLDMQEDFAGKLAAGRPVQAIAELIWNGLDAEATNIKVTAEADELKLTSVTVQDNGHGLSRAEAVRYFQNLGGSWKKASNTSKSGLRHLHGKEGRGRLRALALGRVAEWTVTGKGEEGSSQFGKCRMRARNRLCNYLHNGGEQSQTSIPGKHSAANDTYPGARPERSF